MQSNAYFSTFGFSDAKLEAKKTKELKFPKTFFNFVLWTN